MTRALALMVAAIVGACGGRDSEGVGAGEPEVSDTPETVASVTITSPATGATVPQGTLTVTFEVEGVVVSPAGTMDPGTGHHHLIVDADVTSWSEPLGAEEGRYIHMGQAQTEWVLDALTPGEHRLIAVVADGVHIPLDPPVTDTVWITVEGGA